MNATILIDIDLAAKQEDPARWVMWKANSVTAGLIHAKANLRPSFATSLKSCQLRPLQLPKWES